ncbi:Transglycosylase SLT domain-containing protein [Monaibacterium marinum]|uniref:Transglycosylase SLT domain-containing protein n=1 Tax=Pontivivens marinum TaxID=1690039 RepID=A0A2C9CV61_9RHOB|nr:transglycosylase SLT domain-containing protein [Monaibacterium marinum]SOH95103.1 Transglycosylase SLT domain-containing protein [Monaibacterium marinum]
MKPRYIMAFLMLAGPVHADATLCDVAANHAARDQHIPIDVMRAITLTETGRPRDGELRPWPWTVNLEGAGHWFDTRQQAQSFAEDALSQGQTSFDVGCFQLNWRWHGDAFDSVAAMFDPTANAEYAAKYLNEHFETFGDWSRAAGRYHSGTPEFSERYIARFDEIRGNLPDAGLEPAQNTASVFYLTRATGPLLTRAAGPLHRR